MALKDAIMSATAVSGNPDDTSVGDAWAAFLDAAREGGTGGAARYAASDTFGYDLAMTTAQALNMVRRPAESTPHTGVTRG